MAFNSLKTLISRIIVVNVTEIIFDNKVCVVHLIEVLVELEVFKWILKIIVVMLTS